MLHDQINRRYAPMPGIQSDLGTVSSPRSSERVRCIIDTNRSPGLDSCLISRDDKGLPARVHTRDHAILYTKIGDRGRNPASDTAGNRNRLYRDTDQIGETLKSDQVSIIKYRPNTSDSPFDSQGSET